MEEGHQVCYSSGSVRFYRCTAGSHPLCTEVWRFVFLWFSHAAPFSFADIKSHNLLVDQNDYLKIADLGLSRFTTFDNKDTLFRARGSLEYGSWWVGSDSSCPLWPRSHFFFSFSLAYIFQRRGQVLVQKQAWGSPRSRTFTVLLSSCGMSQRCSLYHVDGISGNGISLLLWKMEVTISECVSFRDHKPSGQGNDVDTRSSAVLTLVQAGKRPDVDAGMPSSLVKLMKICWEQWFCTWNFSFIH